VLQTAGQVGFAGSVTLRRLDSIRLTSKSRCCLRGSDLGHGVNEIVAALPRGLAADCAFERPQRQLGAHPDQTGNRRTNLGALRRHLELGDVHRDVARAVARPSRLIFKRGCAAS
jgi:hypothetical protein